MRCQGRSKKCADSEVSNSWVIKNPAGARLEQLGTGELVVTGGPWVCNREQVYVV